MTSSVASPGIALAEDLGKQSGSDAAVTPMDAVSDAVRKGGFNDDQCFKLLGRLWTLKRLMYYVYGGGLRGST